MKDWIIIFFEGCIGVCLTGAASYLCSYVSAMVEKAKAENDDAMVQKALTHLHNLVDITVRAIEQTAAKELRALVKSGKADKAELIALSQKAVSEIIDNISDDYKTVLKTTVTDLSGYIKNAVEVKVAEIKKENVYGDNDKLDI